MVAGRTITFGRLNGSKLKAALGAGGIIRSQASKFVGAAAAGADCGSEWKGNKEDANDEDGDSLYTQEQSEKAGVVASVQERSLLRSRPANAPFVGSGQQTDNDQPGNERENTFPASTKAEAEIPYENSIK